MKLLLVLVLTVLVSSHLVLSKSLSDHKKDRMLLTLEKEIEKLLHKKTLHSVSSRTVEVDGGTVIIKKNPLNHDQENHNPNADPYSGLSKEEYEAATKKVKLTKVIEEMKTGHKLGNIPNSNKIGDMAMDNSGATEILNAEMGGLTKRKLNADKSLRWPKKINFVVDWSKFATLSADYEGNIREAIQILEYNTCLTFTEGIPSDGSRYMRLNADESGCWSYVGKISDQGPQPVNLGKGCDDVGTILHEIGHALGMYHEQNRPARDKYLNVKWDNIGTGQETQFEKQLGSKTYGSDYDYASVMQYAIKSFSKDGALKTLMPFDADFEKAMGQDVDLSFFDIFALNEHYECDDCPTLKCKNKGIPNPKSNCQKCICPEGYGGDLCDTAGPRSDGCSPSTGELVATDSEQCVSSPNWPNYYTNNDVCNWIIKTGNPSKRIEYYFKGDFFVPFSLYDSHCYHWVEIKDSTNTTQRGKRYCGQISPGFVKTSASDTIITYFSGLHGGSSVKGKGFQLCFKLTDETAASTSCYNKDDHRCSGQSQCVPTSRVCDGTSECHDSSDEKDCPPASCSADQFKCEADNKCITKGWVCDWENDCTDGSDEAAAAGCTNAPASCSADQFKCEADNICITKDWVCDNWDDCTDGSDEAAAAGCTIAPASCSADEFKCEADSKCITKDWVCDDYNDCADGSDEAAAAGCTIASTSCSADEFKCEADSKCIDKSWVCDDYNDCADGSDEAAAAGCTNGGSGNHGSGGHGSGHHGSGNHGSGGHGSGNHGSGGHGSGNHGSGGHGSGHHGYRRRDTSGSINESVRMLLKMLSRKNNH